MVTSIAKCNKEKVLEEFNVRFINHHRTLIKKEILEEKNPMYGRRRFGEENPNYKPYKTEEEREKGRLIEGYGIWRKYVYSRDNYTCQCCFDNQGGNPVAHHLDGYHWYNEGRTNVANGVTLCNGCHTKFHSLYGNFKIRSIYLCFFPIKSSQLI